LAKIALSKSEANGAGQTLTSAAVSLTEAGHVLLAYTPTTPPRHWLIPTGAGEVTEVKPRGVENRVGVGFSADSRRIVFIANEPGHPARDYLFDIASGKL
jgi:hypothetical protein